MYMKTVTAKVGIITKTEFERHSNKKLDASIIPISIKGGTLLIIHKAEYTAVIDVVEEKLIYIHYRNRTGLDEMVIGSIIMYGVKKFKSNIEGNTLNGMDVKEVNELITESINCYNTIRLSQKEKK